MSDPTPHDRARIAVGCDDTCATDHPHRFLRWKVEAAIEAAEEASARKALEFAANLCEKVRCRVWTPEECARQIRSLMTPDTLRAILGRDA